MIGRPRHVDRVEVLFRVAYQQIKNRHSRRWRGEPIITFEEFKSMAMGECTYCGFIGSNKFADTHKGVTYSDTILRINGIDRIDSGLGYSPSNSTTCCKFCNAAKSVMTTTYFKAWVRLVHSHLKL